MVHLRSEQFVALLGFVSMGFGIYNLLGVRTLSVYLIFVGFFMVYIPILSAGRKK